MKACLGCTERHENCHSVCERYQAERKERETISRNRREENMWRTVRIEHTRRVCRKDGKRL